MFLGRATIAPLALALAAAIPVAASAPQQRAGDAAALIDAGATGETAPLEKALAGMRDPAQAALLRAHIAAARLDAAGANRALGTYFAAQDPDARRQAIAWSIRSDVAMNRGDYAAAADAIEHWLKLPAAIRRNKEGANMEQALGIARILASQPMQRKVGGTPAKIATRRDKAGLVLGGATVNGIAQDAVLDTGANLSVVTVSTARKLGLRMLEGAASVGATSSDAIPTRLAVADRMTFAGVELANVVFLVLDDAQLTFPLPGGYTIDAIIGFPVFQALGRIRFGAEGSFAAGDAAGPALRLDNLRVSGSDPYVLSSVNGVNTVLHLDTGATSSSLSQGFATRHPALIAGLPAAQRQSSGAGGAIVVQSTAIWQPATIAIGSRTRTLPRIEIVTDAKGIGNPDTLGVLGQDVLSAFDSYTIDFATMSFELGAPRN